MDFGKGVVHASLVLMLVLGVRKGFLTRFVEGLS